MNKIRSLLFSLHRLLGVIICLFLLMWFVTGLVLIYHSFPNVTKEQKYEKMEPLPSSLPPVDEILSSIPVDSLPRLQKVRQFQGQTLYAVSTPQKTISFVQILWKRCCPLPIKRLKK
ncbi:MAG: PepSY domain-containing protein [Tannerellaceae bacterium]|nr:PepSY domain-containing protein [Tannerellaceae bacterium]